MMNKLEQHVKACSKCIVDLLCKKHNLNYGNMSSVATGKRKTCQGWTLP